MGDVRKEPLAKLYADLGWFYVDRARWSDALGAFESARDEDPDHFGNYWGIGRALYEMSDYAAAADALRVAQEKNLTCSRPRVRKFPGCWIIVLIASVKIMLTTTIGIVSLLERN